MTLSRCSISDPGDCRRCEGTALLVTSLVLMLVSMLAVTAIHHSEQESTAGARSRSSARAVQAGDAGIQLVLSRLAKDPPDLTAFSVNLGSNANLESRTRADATPQNLSQTGIGARKEGFGINAGSSVSFVNRVYTVNVTATSGGSTAEVEAKLGRSGVDITGY